MNLTISCLQINIAFGDPEKNFKQVSQEIEKTVITSKPDIIVLPELWTTGYDLTRLDEIADENGAVSMKFLSELAKKYSVNLVGGSIAKKVKENVTNTMFTFNREGHLIHEYSKAHLFQLMDEHLYLKGGNKTGLFTLENIPSAGMICYDIRFPEWLRAHTTKGAQVLYVVAEWPLARLYHWRSLLIARAIENQCYVVACNRAGADLKNAFAGHSMIIDPWGEIIAEGSEEPETITAEIDLNKVIEVRKQIPIFNDRRKELYD
ncbi:carbon-nitrogen family hydrolase [Metabacillus arenae]|uniref:Carbon-nitrogen family hydrolase n=1 Tax=Metabacillus arenae TaxID=2771434 RepID=A0A926NHZ9_9BACI|nr:carbon-nitrogen family hydrolase [Metabacillus arenae]MBD1380363.1 carbon-nitrogen family hydrolase [Metabacillus arenae]